MNQGLKSKILIAAGVVCLLVAYALVGTLKGEFGKDTVGVKTVDMLPDVIEVSDEQESEKEQHAAQTGEPKQIKAVSTHKASSAWVIYVTGAVKMPGVYEVKPGARAYEALNAAGGFAQNADQEAVNLAAKLQDGEQIKFPTKDETRSLQSTANAPAAESQSSKSKKTGQSKTSGTAAVSESVLININTAGADELVRINGIGPKMAQWIINYRTEHGNFAKKEDIINVRGIGPKKYEHIKDQITVGN